MASHGVFHKNLLKLSDVEIEYELLESKKALNEIVGYCDTYAYPYGAYNKFIRRCVENIISTHSQLTKVEHQWLLTNIS